MAEIDCYEHRIFDTKRINGSNVSYNNTHINSIMPNLLMTVTLSKNHIAVVHYGS